MEEDNSLARTDEVVKLAHEWIGTPYHHQASVKGVGADCIGIVRGLYRDLYGIEPPELINYSADWGDVNGKEDLVTTAFKYLEPVPIEERQPGHVLVMRWKKSRVAKHVMIMTESNKAIHSYNRSVTTEIHLSRWWIDKIAYVFAFPQEVK